MRTISEVHSSQYSVRLVLHQPGKPDITIDVSPCVDLGDEDGVLLSVAGIGDRDLTPTKTAANHIKVVLANPVLRWEIDRLELCVLTENFLQRECNVRTILDLLRWSRKDFKDLVGRGKLTSKGRFNLRCINEIRDALAKLELKLRGD